MKITIATLILVGVTCLSAYGFVLGGETEIVTIKALALWAFLLTPVLVFGIASISLNARELVVIATISTTLIIGFISVVSSYRYPGLAKDVTFGSISHLKLILMQIVLIGAYYGLIIVIASFVRNRK